MHVYVYAGHDPQYDASGGITTNLTILYCRKMRNRYARLTVAQDTNSLSFRGKRVFFWPFSGFSHISSIHAHAPCSMSSKKIKTRKPALPTPAPQRGNAQGVGQRKASLSPGKRKDGPGSNGQSGAKRSSGVEHIKIAGRNLRGNLLENLRDSADHFDETGKQLLKFHGIYQQRDRDKKKRDKQYMFMVRSRIPSGRLTADQYLAHDMLADRYGNGTLRVTTRQGIQLHGVIKTHLQDTLRTINDILLTTLAACGDVVRNTMLSPAPATHPAHEAIEREVNRLAEALLPRTRAYHEVWLDDDKVYNSLSETAREHALNDRRETTKEEPLYGRAYLPRKFKIGATCPGDNSIDVYTQDVGLVAIVENETLAGFNLLVGGGLGMTHKKPQTYPRLGSLIGFVPVLKLIEVTSAIVAIQRDHGDRTDRRHARMKYLIDDWGLDRFVRELERRLGYSLEPPRSAEPLQNNLYLGWRKQLNGRWFVGISVENGRIMDTDGVRLKAGLKAIVERFRPGVRLTPNQDILLTDLDGAVRAELNDLLAAYGIASPAELSNARKYSMACPALPTCGLALSESERVLPSVIDRLEKELENMGLQDERLSIRMTGCPNGCARPYVADIGLVGRSLDRYALFLGGRSDGTRLNSLFKDLVPLDDIVPVLRPVLYAFRKDRQAGEQFGNYCARVGNEELDRIVEKYQSHAQPT